MRLIVDNNLLFSVMKPDSGCAFLFDSLNVSFIAPSFVLDEFRKYREECLFKSKLTEEEFSLREKNIFSKIEFIHFEEYEALIESAQKTSPDKDDSPYFALAMKLGIPIWSNDTLLKEQEEVRILSTKDLFDLL